MRKFFIPADERSSEGLEDGPPALRKESFSIPVRMIRRSIENLGKDKILGVVFNGFTESYKPYHKYYKKYYGKGYGK